MYCLQVRSFIWRSFQEHLDYCTQLNMATRFCKIVKSGIIAALLQSRSN